MADIEELRRLLTIEHDALRKSIEKFDDLRYRVKASTVTANGALIALSVNAGNAEIVWVGVGATLLFFFIDLQYMMLQTLAIDGSEDAEALLDSLRAEPTLDVGHDYRFGLGKVFIPRSRGGECPRYCRTTFT